MPLHVTKYERFQGADRNDLALAALEVCRAAREADEVTSSRFYWIDPNEIAILIDAEPGAWGPGSAAQPSSRGASAMFALADLARNTVNETWMDARAGEETYNLAQ